MQSSSVMVCTFTSKRRGRLCTFLWPSKKSLSLTYFSKFVSWQFVNVEAQLPFLIISHGRNFGFIVCVQWRMCRSCRCVVFGFFGSSLFRRFFPSGATTCFGLKKRFVILKTGRSIVSKGQKISNGNCGVINSPKNERKGTYLKIKVPN